MSRGDYLKISNDEITCRFCGTWFWLVGHAWHCNRPRPTLQEVIKQAEKVSAQ